MGEGKWREPSENKVNNYFFRCKQIGSGICPTIVFLTKTVPNWVAKNYRIWRAKVLRQWQGKGKCAPLSYFTFDPQVTIILR
jgi:hypothetical protein